MTRDSGHSGGRPGSFFSRSLWCSSPWDEANGRRRIQFPAQAAKGNGTATSSKNADQPRKTPYPTIVKTVPEVGATDVSSSLKEITVTFDRDMSGGMSWTGSGPEFPPVDESRKATWTDKRSCTLPVRLERGTFLSDRDQFEELPELQERRRRSESPDGPLFRHSGCQQGGRTTGTRSRDR